MNKAFIFIFFLLFIFGCGGSSSIKESTNNEQIKYVFDNDIFDEDNWNTPLIANFVGSSYVIQTESGPKSSSIFYNLIKDKTKLSVSTNSNDRVLPIIKSVRFLDSIGRATNDKSFPDPYIVLSDILKNNKIKYSTGGKLIFLNNFIQEPSRLKLFIDNVESIHFGLGCNPLGSKCKDFNLAMTQKAWNATVGVYNKLHNKVPFVVGSVKYNNNNIYNISKGIIKEIYKRGNYKSIDKIGLGDIDSFFIMTNLANSNCIKGNIVLGNKKFVFKKGNGTDKYCYIQDDVVGIMKNVILYNNDIIK